MRSKRVCPESPLRTGVLANRVQEQSAWRKWLGRKAPTLVCFHLSTRLRALILQGHRRTSTPLWTFSLSFPKSRWQCLQPKNKPPLPSGALRFILFKLHTLFSFLGVCSIQCFSALCLCLFQWQSHACNTGCSCGNCRRTRWGFHPAADTKPPEKDKPCCRPQVRPSLLKNLPAVQKTWVRSLGQQDPLEKGMTNHSSILSWRIPWTEEPGGLHSMGSQSQTRLNDYTHTHTHTHTHTQRKGGPGEQALKKGQHDKVWWSPAWWSMMKSCMVLTQLKKIFKVSPSLQVNAYFNVMWQPGWERSLGENVHMYMNGWVPLLSSWNYHNTVN